MVPNGWLHTTLGNVMSFKNGLNFTKADIGEPDYHHDSAPQDYT